MSSTGLYIIPVARHRRRYLVLAVAVVVAVVGTVLALAVPNAAATPGRAGTVATAASPAGGSAPGGSAPGGIAAGVASSNIGCSATAIGAALNIPGLTVTSATPEGPGTVKTPQGSLSNLPAFCSVELTQLDSSGNPIHIYEWLPSKWNGSFQGTGGGGFLCGPFYSEFADGITAGYATAGTDCGSSDPTGGFALTGSGQLNHSLINDFAYIGIHDMTVDGKALTKAYYTKPATYAYFNGCSTGGREGLMEAQRYPNDYNGIVSGSPAINWGQFIPSEIWPELVMLQNNDFLPTCIEKAFTEAVTRACGNAEGIIENPAACKWDPRKLVGLVTPCGTITAQDATVVEKIWDGPVSTSGKKLWYGLEPGASFLGLADTTTSSSGVTSGNPFPIAVAWLGTWLQKNPNWNWETLTYSEFDKLFEQSVKEFGPVIGTNNPDLTRFKDHGGKLVIWHGLADQLIFPQGSVNYYDRVIKAMGGEAKTDTFARLYLAPGAQHCTSDAGPAPGVPYSYPDPGNPLPLVVKWVKTGKAPLTITAVKYDPATNVITQDIPLCAYPLTTIYTHGNPNYPSSYKCSGRLPTVNKR